MVDGSISSHIREKKGKELKPQKETCEEPPNLIESRVVSLSLPFPSSERRDSSMLFSVQKQHSKQVFTHTIRHAQEDFHKQVQTL